MQTDTYDRDEVKQMFEDQGVTVTEWANRNGFRREDVYAVLNGRLKGRRGKSHAIAVALGLKPSRPTQGRLHLAPETPDEPPGEKTMD